MHLYILTSKLLTWNLNTCQARISSSWVVPWCAAVLFCFGLFCYCRWAGSFLTTRKLLRSNWLNNPGDCAIFSIFFLPCESVPEGYDTCSKDEACPLQLHTSWGRPWGAAGGGGKKWRKYIQVSAGFWELYLEGGRLPGLWLCLNYWCYSCQLSVGRERVEVCRVSFLMWNELTHSGDYVKNDLIYLKIFSKTSPRAFYINPLGINFP